MNRLRCDYCCRLDHHIENCPHLKKDLLDPNPRFNGLRGMIKEMERIVDHPLVEYDEPAGENHELT